MDNNTNLDNWGKPKTNAWKWILGNYGFIMASWLTIVILTFIYATPGINMILIFLILAAAPTALLIYVPKWYKQLVSDNYILPFERSPFKDILKK